MFSLLIDTGVPGSPVLSVTQAITNDNKPVIGGTAEAGSTVSIYRGNTQLGQVAASSGGVISFIPTTALPDGTYVLTATASDFAGNISAASISLSLVIDTAAPNAPTLTGASLTNSNRPILSGVAEAGSTVSILEGGTTLGQATVARLLSPACWTP